MTTTRGRKSADSKQIVTIISSRQSPNAPIGIGEDATALWEKIANSVPNDFFRAGDLPLLEAYVISATRKRQLDTKVLQEGIMFNGEPHPALRISRDEASLMASLAVKLRLCQSSRTRPESASLNVTRDGKRPWDVTNNE